MERHHNGGNRTQRSAQAHQDKVANQVEVPEHYLKLHQSLRLGSIQQGGASRHLKDDGYHLHNERSVRYCQVWGFKE